MPPPNGQLTEFEQSLVALGISAATAFSLPKSVGAMFGLTFASPQPLALDDYVARLEISKGSASQGLKFLQRMGAVRPVYFGQETSDEGRGKSDKGQEIRDKGQGTRDEGREIVGRRSSLVPRPSSLRKTYYEPEMSLRRLLIGILNENVLPHLQQSGDRVASLKEQLDQNGFSKEEMKLLKHRLDTLEGWGKKTRMLWPLAERVLSGPLKGK